ncbi:hypothetical protein [Devosia elaeis]|uniref:Uncharacterized protein n=1 Tax=Devosia elaeis TaxID=1770058 RepID=A0A178I071_9HYPH|nr:hypothetical protein [Devosia elaeis]OAM77714.1 hypothetical protein A3840_08795 [Devosia elaeis]
MTIASSNSILFSDGSDIPSRVEHAPSSAKAVAAQKRRLAKLDAKRPDWINCPANDNQAWPLAQWLRKDGNEVLLKVAERYRAIYDVSVVEVPLIGTVPDDIYNVPIDNRTHTREDGTVVYKGQRKVKSAIGQFDGDDGTYKVVPVSDDVTNEMVATGQVFPRKPAKPVPRKWNGDRLIIEAIDCRKIIRRLQAALGPLMEPFEDAVLHGETLSAIGEARGATGKASSAPAGRVLVMMGLEVVQRELAAVDREGN